MNPNGSLFDCATWVYPIGTLRWSMSTIGLVPILATLGFNPAVLYGLANGEVAGAVQIIVGCFAPIAVVYFGFSFFHNPSCYKLLAALTAASSSALANEYGGSVFSSAIIPYDNRKPDTKLAREISSCKAL